MYHRVKLREKVIESDGVCCPYFDKNKKTCNHPSCYKLPKFRCMFKYVTKKGGKNGR